MTVLLLCLQSLAYRRLNDSIIVQAVYPKTMIRNIEDRLNYFLDGLGISGAEVRNAFDKLSHHTTPSDLVAH